MPAPLMSRDDVVARLLTVFRDHGYAGASLSEISRATGLGKSSMYHYFPGGKEDMAIAVLERIDAWMRTHALEPLRGPGTPAQRLKKMLDALDEFYDGGRNACLLGVLVLGGARARFQAQLRGSFEKWIDALTALAVESGAPRREAQQRAQDAVARIEGALVLAGGLDDAAPFSRMLRKIPEDLLGPGARVRRREQAGV